MLILEVWLSACGGTRSYNKEEKSMNGRFHRFLSMLLTLALVCALFAPAAAVSVSAAKNDITLEKGETVTLKVNPGSQYNTTWKTSDKTVATVSGSGVVKAVGEGTATITATSKNVLSRINYHNIFGKNTITTTYTIQVLAPVVEEPQPTVPEETVPPVTEPEETVPEETAPPATEPEETVPEETVPPATEPEETVPEETAPPATEPEETVPEETVPEETVPPATEPEETVPEETVPPVTEPEETVPEETVPEETVPPVTEPEETVPEETVPPATEPEETVPEETVPPATEPPATKPANKNGMEIGETTKLKVNHGSNYNTTWKSSDESVATVSSNGTVTAVGAGKATITAVSTHKLNKINFFGIFGIERKTATFTIVVNGPVVEEPQPTEPEETIPEETVPEETEPEVVDLTEKLDALMHKNAADMRRVYSKYGRIYAAYYYYHKVKDGGDWDIKLTNEWKFEEGKTYVYQGKVLRHDDPGNIHFGYTGAVIFEEELVCAGAGANNVSKFGFTTGNFRSYYDDPQDQEMMRWGHRLYMSGYWSIKQTERTYVRSVLRYENRLFDLQR